MSSGLPPNHALLTRPLRGRPSPRDPDAVYWDGHRGVLRAGSLGALGEEARTL